MKLTDKQEAFALEYVMNGGNASAAYRKCYDVGEDTKDTTVWRDAHKTLNKPNVDTRIGELRSERFSRKILSLEERRALLTEWALEGDKKSLDMLNRMDGVYVEKHEVDATHRIKRTIIVNPTKDD